jgi:mitochondrial fission protein ELM1
MFSTAMAFASQTFLITSGRKSAAAAIYAKKKHGDRVFTLHVQDPKISSAPFDLVSVPQHDTLRGDNVVVTDAAPNRITPENLQIAKDRFRPLFGQMPGLKIGLLIGGNSRTHQLTDQDFKYWQRLVSGLENYSVMATASRRTPDLYREKIQKQLQSFGAYFYDGKGENPYIGILAWADVLIVSEDSVSMISEAATAGKPIYTLPLSGNSAKFERFYAHMKALNILRPFDGIIDQWTYAPLNDAAKVTKAVQTRMIETGFEPYQNWQDQ